jgi:hypothetical protein
MTTLTRPREIWSTMPGWGISVDLTPPELIASRQLKVLRKFIVLGLVAVLLLCAGAFVLAGRKHSAASAALEKVQIRTAQLESESHKFGGVTRLQGTVTQVQAQIAKLMGDDVDLVALMGRIRGVLPSTMTISQELVTITLAAPGVANGGGSGSGNGLDTSGAVGIGNIKIAGTGRTLDDLSVYVDKLARIPGVIDVVPTSNVLDKKGVQYSVALGMTDLLLSHRFDLSKNGGK